MKNIYILIALSLYCGFRMEVYCQTLPFGQVVNCDDFEAASFVHTVDRASFPDNWDWRDATLSNWQVYMKLIATQSYVSKELPSPFQPPSPTNHPNVKHLSNGQLPDYQPSDGWELVFRYFGTGPSFALAAEYPTFVLYNRFNGMMRVFMWTEYDRQGFNEAALRLRFNTALQKGSAMLGLVENPPRSLEGFDVEIEAATPNEWGLCQNCGTWLFADIPIAYDPCTCEQSPNAQGVTTDNIS